MEQIQITGGGENGAIKGVFFFQLIDPMKLSIYYIVPDFYLHSRKKKRRLLKISYPTISIKKSTRTSRPKKNKVTCPHIVHNININFSTKSLTLPTGWKEINFGKHLPNDNMDIGQKIQDQYKSDEILCDKMKIKGIEVTRREIIIDKIQITNNAIKNIQERPSTQPPPYPCNDIQPLVTSDYGKNLERIKYLQKKIDLLTIKLPEIETQIKRTEKDVFIPRIEPKYKEIVFYIDISDSVLSSAPSDIRSYYYWMQESLIENIRSLRNDQKFNIVLIEEGTTFLFKEFITQLNFFSTENKSLVDELMQSNPSVEELKYLAFEKSFDLSLADKSNRDPDDNLGTGSYWDSFNYAIRAFEKRLPCNPNNERLNIVISDYEWLSKDIFSKYLRAHQNSPNFHFSIFGNYDKKTVSTIQSLFPNQSSIFDVKVTKARQKLIKEKKTIIAIYPNSTNYSINSREYKKEKEEIERLLNENLELQKKMELDLAARKKECEEKYQEQLLKFKKSIDDETQPLESELKQLEEMLNKIDANLRELDAEITKLLEQK